MSDTGPSVLVVDDDTDTCHNLADILGDLGYHVETAHDGPSALEKIRARAYDVALLDFKMPGMNGLELYREIRKLRAETVAIVVTAFASKATQEQALAAGAWQVLPKPVDAPRLLKLVGEAMDRPLVMVVDDDRDLCGALQDILQERSYRVCVAHDEDQARRQLADHTFEVVLIDMRLPNSDGSRVFRLVRETNPEARTLIVTGFHSETDGLVQQVVAEGADAVCYKPFDVSALLSTLQRLTGEKVTGSSR